MLQVGVTGMKTEIDRILNVHALCYRLFKMPQLEYMQLFDIMYIRSGCETAIVFNCKTLAHELFMNP
jgi:hypothetical protein